MKRGSCVEHHSPWHKGGKYAKVLLPSLFTLFLDEVFSTIQAIINPWKQFCNLLAHQKLNRMHKAEIEKGEIHWNCISLASFYIRLLHAFNALICWCSSSSIFFHMCASSWVALQKVFISSFQRSVFAILNTDRAFDMNEKMSYGWKGVKGKFKNRIKLFPAFL